MPASSRSARERRAFISARTLLLVTLLAVPTGLVALKRLRAARRAVAPVSGTTRINTTLHAVDVDVRGNLLPAQPMRGGAIDRFGDGFLIVTASGEFWTLAPSMHARRLPWRAPLERDRYLHDLGEQPGPRDTIATSVFRVTDLLVDTIARPAALYVSHQHWNSSRRCLTMRVSAAALPADTASAALSWRTVFESHPCLPISERYDPYETGGRMAWLTPGAILLTIGDHGFSGLSGDPPLAQDSAGSYGKTMRIDLDEDRASRFSMGHRNPQGLVVARDGRIWASEHGPKGGDEINLLAEGGNFGWPLVTYGAAYNLDRWPIGGDQANHGAFTEPAYVFMPSTAVSSMIQLAGDTFSRWRDDFLVGTLKGRALYRIRTRGDRVTYAERIPIGVRVRDLVEGTQGQIVAYDGERSFAVVSLATPDAGEVAFAQCATCHGADRRGTTAAPSLRRLFGRRVATHPDFAFSPALRARGGAWNDETLDRFLADPQAFAPGTSMDMPGVRDQATRAAIIGWLKSMDGVVGSYK